VNVEPAGAFLSILFKNVRNSWCRWRGAVIRLRTVGDAEGGEVCDNYGTRKTPPSRRSAAPSKGPARRGTSVASIMPVTELSHWSQSDDWSATGHLVKSTLIRAVDQYRDSRARLDWRSCGDRSHRKVAANGTDAHPAKKILSSSR
jgi:hypothetical protein